MRQIDKMSEQELDTLKLKGMLNDGKLKKATSEPGDPQKFIREGDKVVHEDRFGTSAGFADSDQLTSRGEVKVRFTFGPRKGECRWTPLCEVKSVQRCFDDADDESDIAILDPTRPAERLPEQPKSIQGAGEPREIGAKAQHSPLPWKITQDSAGTIDISCETPGIRSRIARLHIEHLCDEHDFGGVQANAAFMVRAVNNAERLAEACRRAIEEMQGRPREGWDAVQGCEDALEAWEAAQ